MSTESFLGILMCVAFFGTMSFAMWRIDSRKRNGYLDSHPPISDEEFVNLCSPGTDPVLAVKVRQIVAETLSIEKERIYPDSRFIEDLGAD